MYIPDFPANEMVTIFKSNSFGNMRVQKFAIILIPFPVPNDTVNIFSKAIVFLKKIEILQS
jgi:hypothetical protein